MGYRSGLSSFIRDLPEELIEFGSSQPLGRRNAIQWPATKSRSRPPQKGHPSGLRSGDRVNHPAFGPGVISKFMDGEKVEVLFRNVGRKLLHLGYTTLERR